MSQATIPIDDISIITGPNGRVQVGNISSGTVNVPGQGTSSLSQVLGGQVPVVLAAGTIATTPSAGDSSAKVATTQFVATAVASQTLRVLQSISASYTFQVTDNLSFFYVTASVALSIPSGLPAGWRVYIETNGSSTVTLNAVASSFLGLSGNPTSITIGSTGPSSVEVIYTGTQPVIMAASPEVYQAYNGIHGNLVSITGQYTMSGTSGGTVTWTMPFQGPAYKKVLAYFSSYENGTTTAQSIAFPVAFSNVPFIGENSTGLTIDVSTTSMSIVAPDSTQVYNGWVVVEGF